MKHIALHTCCAPCLIGAYAALNLDTHGGRSESVPTSYCHLPLPEQNEDRRITAVYYNPNIAPEEEYLRRRDTCKRYAADNGIDFVELPYDPESWDAATHNGTLPQAERCRACYRLRLERVACWAREQGCDVFTTTLTISPYQDQEAIAAAGSRSAIEASEPQTPVRGKDLRRDSAPKYVPRDFRPYFHAAQQRARDLGIYRQNYCGCLPSKERR